MSRLQCGRLGMRHRHLLDRAIGLQQVNGAPVGQLRHGELRQRGELRFVIHGIGEPRTGFGQQPIGFLKLLLSRAVA